MEPTSSTLTRPNNLSLVELKADQLHDTWPFIRRGLEDIHKRLHPDWIPENQFTALVGGHASCVIVYRDRWVSFHTQEHRPLGFAVYYKQIRPFSQKPELFVWSAWALPLRDRLENDPFPEAIELGWSHLCDVAKTAYGTDRISWITSQRRSRAWEKRYGWKAAWAGYNVTV